VHIAIAASIRHRIRYTERLGEGGIEPSVGSVGGQHTEQRGSPRNNQQGLFQARKVIHRRGPPPPPPPPTWAQC